MSMAEVRYQKSPDEKPGVLSWVFSSQIIVAIVGFVFCLVTATVIVPYLRNQRAAEDSAQAKIQQLTALLPNPRDLPYPSEDGLDGANAGETVRPPIAVDRARQLKGLVYEDFVLAGTMCNSSQEREAEKLVANTTRIVYGTQTMNLLFELVPRRCIPTDLIAEYERLPRSNEFPRPPKKP
jgi:hypothetical protein